MVCETCWSIATNRAYGRGGCAADYYSDVLKEREGICEEGPRGNTVGLIVVDEVKPVTDEVWKEFEDEFPE